MAGSASSSLSSGRTVAQAEAHSKTTESRASSEERREATAHLLLCDQVVGVEEHVTATLDAQDDALAKAEAEATASIRGRARTRLEHERIGIGRDLRETAAHGEERHDAPAGKDVHHAAE